MSLSPEQNKRLGSRPPYAMDLENLVKKHWGNNSSLTHVNNFIHDVRQYHNNLLTVLTEQQESESCDKCDLLAETLELIKKHSGHLYTALVDLRTDFEKMQREHLGNRWIFPQPHMLDEVLAELEELEVLANEARDLLGQRQNRRLQNTTMNLLQTCNNCYQYDEQVSSAWKLIKRLSLPSDHLIVQFFQLRRELRTNRVSITVEDKFDNLFDAIFKMYIDSNKLRELMGVKNEENMSQE